MKRVLLLLFAAGVAAIFAGCAPFTGLPNPVSSDDTGTPVKIGVVLPLSGPDADFGKRTLRGVEMAAFKLNNGRGISGRRVELLVRDTKSEPAEARHQVEALFNEDISGLVGPYSTNEALAIKSAVETLMIPTVVPLATTDSLTEGTNLIYRTCFTDAQQGEALAAYCWYWRKYLRIAILINQDKEAVYSRSVAQATANAFTELGGEVVQKVEFRGNFEEFAKKLNELVSYNPQAILVPAEPENAGKLVKYIRQLGYRGLLLGPESWDDPVFFANCGKDPGDCAFVGLYSDEFDVAEQHEFREEFRRRFFIYPSSCEAQGYDALNMLAIGLGNARSVEDFNRNMQQIRNVPGASALYTMKAGGDIDRTMFIMSVRPSPLADDYPEARLNQSFNMHRIYQMNED